ncbi:TetR/AcrR family transcriptional regulator [Streptomyces sp. ME19-01-6]|uniref:TetR/AcrR family transcriptional regulator n=1 Tax=Streptomyces sp. ME19-01-6 TaxID=3028686 RepID=UPI0029B58537|nr:TetR/AcrR family transcriptional regulator [Streptomyces sp. ME19-01-6]MDX3225005.1 TetR/AcrR family transcriptional regulator [Streptomyces sp. ME19-01-6]
MGATRRRRDEYAEATRNAIVEAASDLFSRSGYAKTSLDDIADHARVTKGAIYHHFTNKQAVFEAVLAEIDQRFVRRVEQKIGPQASGWSAFVTALNAYLDASLDPAFCEMALKEGPIALGWERWRLAQGHVTENFAELVKRRCADEFMREMPSELVMKSIIGALHEMALAVSNSPNPQQARKEASALISELVESLRSSRSERSVDRPG